MRILPCIVIIALSAAFVTSRPLTGNVVAAPDPKIKWTDLMPSSNVNEMDSGSSSYKEFEHAADQKIRKLEQQKEKEDQVKESEEGQVNNYNPDNSNIDLNQEAVKWIRGNDLVDDSKAAASDQGQLNSQTTTTTDKETSDKNGMSGDTKYAFDIIMKPSESEAQVPRSDTTLMGTGTRNAFSKNEITGDTTDYANRVTLVQDNSLPVAASHPQDEQELLPSSIQIGDENKEEDEEEKEGREEGEEESTRFDFFDALDQALLDPFISGIDSDLNSEVYEVPFTETTTWQVATNGDIFDYKSLIAEQIRSAEEEIRIKHDELIQDQQQIDDLKRKIHHSSTISTITSNATATAADTTTTTATPLTSWPNPTFSMEVIESGPDETMYIYKHIPPTPSSTITVQQQQQQQQHANLGTSVTHSPLPLTKTPDLETDQQEMKAEQNVPSAVIQAITPFYNLVQKQTDEEDYYQAKIKKGSASTPVAMVGETVAVDAVIPPQGGDTTPFDPSNKLKLPNGNWTPSCKNVSKGLYCLQPDGQGATIIECLGENVGFQFSCGKNMLCYSTGPFDVDCQKAQGFINDE